MKFFLRVAFIFFLTLTVFSTLSAQVTQIWTDYNNTLWTSSSTSLNPIKPENSHNLLAFKFGSTTYSTGVNDAMLINGGVTFTPGNWQAFPISSVPTSGGTSYLVSLGQLYDGVNNGTKTSPSVFTPSNATTLASFLTDGRNGLNIGTGLANIASGQTLRFNLSTNGIVRNSINDGIPDILFAQTASPSAGGDRLKFVNSSGQTVGTEITIDLSNTTNYPKVADWTADFYNPDATPTNLTPSSNFINSDRPISLFAADLSALGITTSNYQNAVALVYTTGGSADPAFIAYNEPAINIPGFEVISQPSYYTSGSAMSPSFQVALKDENGNILIPNPAITVTASLESGSGSLSGTLTATTNASGIATFSNLIITAASGGTHQIKFSEPNYNPAISSYLNCSVTPSGSPVTITLVESGGTTCGWSVNNGVLSALANVSINAAEIENLLLNGNLTISADQDIVINGNIDPALRGSTTLTLKAGRNIQLEGSRTIQPTLAALNVVFWADADGDQTGMVWIKNATTLQTNNGHLWIGGGSGSSIWNGLTVGDGYAIGGTFSFTPVGNRYGSADYHNVGVMFDVSSNVATGSGHIYIAGKSGTSFNTGTTYGINNGIYILKGTSITTTNGNIEMNGVCQLANHTPCTGSNCGFRYGILLENEAGYPITIQSTGTGNIQLNGQMTGFNGSTDNQNNAGLTLFSTSSSITDRILVSTNSGNISLTGNNQTTTVTAGRTRRGIWLTSNPVYIKSTSGNVVIDAQIATNFDALRTDATTLIGDGTTGNITIKANTWSTAAVSAIFQASGSLSIQPTSPTTTIAVGGATGVLQLPATYFTTNFSDGFSSIIIGSDNQSGDINLNALTIREPMIFKTSGNLTLGGILDLGSNDLTLGENTTISAGSSQYFRTSGTGLLKRTIANNTSFSFPIGNAGYNPLTITNKTGLSDLFSARVMDAVYLNGSSGTVHTSPRVNVTWDIDKATANQSSGIDFQFQWNSSQETGGINSFRLNHYGLAGWGFAEGTPGLVNGTTTKTLTHTGYTGSFSPFAISSSTSTLPVSLIRFDARCSDNGVLLTWSTATEQQHSHFEIERSISGAAWTNIGIVKGAGNSSTVRHYQLTDPFYGSAQYRLVQIDMDGTKSILPMASVRCGTNLPVKIHPNPTIADFIIQGGKKSTVFRIYNQSGQKVEQGILSSSLQHVSSVRMHSGMYYVHFTDVNGEQRIEKLQVIR